MNAVVEKLKPVWREIVSRARLERAGRYAGSGRYVFTLSCGHTHQRKISDGVPSDRIRCTTCEALRESGADRETRNDDGSRTFERWDPAVQMPKRWKVAA